MAQGVDVKLKLAQSLAKMDTQNGVNLQEMFDVLQVDEADDDMYGDYHMMLTLEELVGNVIETLPANVFVDDDAFSDAFDVFDILDSIDEVLSSRFTDIKIPIISENKPFSEIMPLSMDAPDSGFTKRSLKKVPAGQLSIFGF